MQLQTAATAYFWKKQLLLFVFSLPYLSDNGVVRMADDWQVTAVPVITLAAEAAPVDANAADAAAPSADGGDGMLLLMLLPFVTSAITWASHHGNRDYLYALINEGCHVVYTS